MDRKEEANSDQLLTEYIKRKVETEYKIGEDLSMKNKENKWIVRELIRKDGPSFQNIKEEWMNIMIDPSYQIKNEKGIVIDSATLRKKYEACKQVYDERYQLKDSKEYPFQVMFYFFYRDQLIYVQHIEEDYIDASLTILSNLFNIDSFRIDMDNTLDRLKKGQDKIIHEIKDLQRQLAFYERMESIPSYPFCNIITKLDEKIPFIPERPEHDLWYYFNKVVCNEIIPFCTYQNFYKFLENCVVQPEWLEEPSNEQDAIVCYVKFNDEYQKIYISSTFIIVQLLFSQDKTPDEMLGHLSSPSSFSLPRLESSPFTQKSIKSICYVNIPLLKEEYKNIKLLLYFIQSQPTYSSILFAEESRVIMSDRQFLFLTYYTNPLRPKEYVSFNIRYTDNDEVKKMECFDDEHKTYMKLTIKHCPNSSLVSKTVSMLTFLMEEFVRNFKRIQLQFNGRGMEPPQMKIIQKKDVKASSKNEVIIGRTRGQQDRPSIYSVPQQVGQVSAIPIDSFYHRNLKNEPLFIQEALREKNIQNKEENLLQGIIFPKDGKNWNETKYFVCDREPSKKYIDLKELQEGFVPSCFSTNKDGKKSKLDQFLEEDKQEKDKKPNEYFVTRGNILDPDKFGSVLQWIKRWYALAQPNRLLFRKGVANDSKHSILFLMESVKLHMTQPTSKMKITEDYIRPIHQKMVKALKKKFPYEIITEALPFFPTISIEEVKTKCMELFENGYIHPLLFYSFLTNWYQMDIIFFKKDGLKNPPFYLYHPSYYQSYQGTLYSECVGVALNQGLEFWNFDDPFCELMVSVRLEELDESYKIGKKSNYEYTMTHCQAYIELCLKEMYGKKIVPTCSFFDAPIVSQDFDRYGMTTTLNVTIHGIPRTLLLLEPIHSISIPHDTSVHLWTLESIQQFKKEHRLEISPVYQSYGNYQGVVVSYQNQSFVLPIYKDEGEHAMSQYIQFEKISRYMKEHACFLFSRFVQNQSKVYYELLDKKLFHEKNKEEEDLRSVLSELGKKTLLSPSTLYGYLDEFIDQGYISIQSIEDHVFVEQFSKDRLLSVVQPLRVTSEEVIRKLVYMLMLEYQTNRDELLDYASKINMRNYYVHPYDLDSIPMHQIMTRTSFLSFLKHKDVVFQKGSLVPKPRISPLFTKKDGEDIQVFQADGTCYKLYKTFIEYNTVHEWIMQPVSSLAQAIFLSEEWSKNKINAMNLWRHNFILSGSVEEDSKEMLQQCNQFIWSSETEYEFIPSIQVLEYNPRTTCISVFHIRDKRTPHSKTYIHVMLPC
jgi:hypothetical protein